MTMEPIRLTVTDRDGRACTGWPLTRGVPLPEGAVGETGELMLAGPGGDAVPVQLRPLARWPDGSLKWVLADFQARTRAGGWRTTSVEGVNVPARKRSADSPRCLGCTGRVVHAGSHRHEITQPGLASRHCALSEAIPSVKPGPLGNRRRDSPTLGRLRSLPNNSHQIAKEVSYDD